MKRLKIIEEFERFFKNISKEELLRNPVVRRQFQALKTKLLLLRHCQGLGYLHLVKEGI